MGDEGWSTARQLSRCSQQPSKASASQEVTTAIDQLANRPSARQWPSVG